LGLVLGTVGQELAPFGLAGGGEQRLQPSRVGLVAAGGVEQDDLTVAAFDQVYGALHALGERGRGRQGPYALPQRERTHAPQLAPDRYSVARRLSRQPHCQHRPGEAIALRHGGDCSICYFESDQTRRPPTSDTTTRSRSPKPRSTWRVSAAGGLSA